MIITDITKRLSARPDSEFEQALVRVVIVASVWISIYIGAHQGWLEVETGRYLRYCAIYLGLALLLLVFIIWRPVASPTRRVLGIMGDMAMLSVSVVLVGNSGIMFYPIFLWVTIGNGLRFGQRYLYLAMVASLLGFGTAVANSDYLMDYPLVVLGLILGLIALPVYVSMLLRRLHRAMADLNNVNAQMTRLATRDSLTGLPNRALFFEHLGHAIALSRRRSTTFAVLFIDIDGFKLINDLLGHATGDQVIKQVANILIRCVRASDTVARLGGDEFVILLNDIPSQQTGQVAEKILSALTKISASEIHSLAITASIGIAHYPDSGQDAEALVDRADLAMYEAKKAGKNTFRNHQTRAWQ